jgi:hypothetical protein
MEVELDCINLNGYKYLGYKINNDGFYFRKSDYTENYIYIDKFLRKLNINNYKDIIYFNYINKCGVFDGKQINQNFNNGKYSIDYKFYYKSIYITEDSKIIIVEGIKNISNGNLFENDDHLYHISLNKGILILQRLNYHKSNNKYYASLIWTYRLYYIESERFTWIIKNDRLILNGDYKTLLWYPIESKVPQQLRFSSSKNIITTYIEIDYLKVIDYILYQLNTPKISLGKMIIEIVITYLS